MIYAISLWQPWASFIAIGVKPYETRSWRPPQRLIGKRIAVHAAKTPVSADNREWAARHGVQDLPLGAIVCTAVLAGAYQCNFTSGRHAGILQYLSGSPSVYGAALTKGGIAVDEFGDYSPDRWAWLLTGIELATPPVQARGAQGFWKWDQPPLRGGAVDRAGQATFGTGAIAAADQGGNLTGNNTPRIG